MPHKRIQAINVSVVAGARLVNHRAERPSTTSMPCCNPVSWQQIKGGASMTAAITARFKRSFPLAGHLRRWPPFLLPIFPAFSPAQFVDLLIQTHISQMGKTTVETVLLSQTGASVESVH